MGKGPVDAQRRRLVVGLGLSALIAPSLMSCGGTSDEDGGESSQNADKVDEVEYLFVQSAEQTVLVGGQLRLGGISPSTIYFSDRPERIAGQLSTEEFVSKWGYGGEKSFDADPPNATVSILSGPEPQEIVMVLSSPRLENGDLIYDVQVLEGNQEAAGEASAVFIDVYGRPATPVSAAGTRRRVRRRTAAVVY